MRRISIIVATLAMFLSGCTSNRVAREYARALNGVAKSYQQQVALKAKAEQESYQDLGLIYDQAIQDNAYETLWLERSERARQIADDIVYGSRHQLSPTSLTRALRTYGDLDFQTLKQQLGAEQAAHVQLLSGIQSLESDVTKIQALSQSLEGLGNPTSLQDELKNAINYGNSVKLELQHLNCNDLSQKLKQLQALLTQASTASAKVKLNQEIKETSDLLKANNCN